MVFVTVSLKLMKKKKMLNKILKTNPKLYEAKGQNS
jgi:hypothetical protein